MKQIESFDISRLRTGEDFYGTFIDEVNFFVDREKKNITARNTAE